MELWINKKQMQTKHLELAMSISKELVNMSYEEQCASIKLHNFQQPAENQKYHLILTVRKTQAPSSAVILKKIKMCNCITIIYC